MIELNESEFFNDKVELLEHYTFSADFDQKGYLSTYYGFIPNTTVDTLSMRELIAYMNGRIEAIESFKRIRRGE